MLITTIYGLVDPTSQELRYVGKTIRRLKDRLYGHIRDTSKTHRGYWIRSLLKRGVEPDIFEIELVEGDTWIEAEQFWIAYFRFIGANLVNMTIGGDGVTGIKDSDETKKKKSAGMRGIPKSEACKKKLSDANKGKKHTPESIAKMSAAHKGVPSTQKGRKKRGWSDEDKAQHKITMAGKNEGVPWSKERRRASENGNVTWSEEHRAKFKASMQERYATGWSPTKSHKQKNVPIQD